MRSARFTAGAVAALLLVPWRAGADVPRLKLEIHRCVRVNGELVSSLVQVELKGHVSAMSSDASRVAVEVQCTKRGTSILIVDEDGLPVAARVIDLGAFGTAARARLLALSIAEMVGAIWEVPPASPIPELKDLALPPSVSSGGASQVDKGAAGLDAEIPAPTKAKAEPTSVFDLSARATARKFGGGPFQFGVSLGAALSFQKYLAAGADLSFERGSRSTLLGDVAGNTVSLGAWVGARLDLEPFEVRGGVGLRGGVAILKGSPNPSAQGGTVTGPWVGPMLAVAGRWSHERFLVEVSVDGGVNLVPVRGLLESGGEVSISGAWLGLHVGAGWKL
jgi:hypothetical protein